MGRRVPQPGEKCGAAEAVVWEHYQFALRQGRRLSGADLDRVAGTNNYGRSVLARWRNGGLIDDRPVGSRAA